MTEAMGRSSYPKQSREDRFETMYRENYSAVLRYALRRADFATASDVVAETFVVAWRRFDDVPPHAIPWLLGVARKTLANKRRADARQAATSAQLRRSSPDTAYDPGEYDRSDRVVLAAVNRLPRREREAITLLAWDQLTSAEAAKAAGCTPVAFRVRLHRARKRLRRELAIAEESSGHFVNGTATEEAK